MAFQPDPQKTFHLFGLTLRFRQAPGNAGDVLRWQGQQSIIYALESCEAAGDGDSAMTMALKVIPRAVQSPHIARNSAFLRSLASLEGMKAASRHVIVPENHTQIVQEYPELRYAVMMPLLMGRTWRELKEAEYDLQPEGSLRLAKVLAYLLAALENQGIAHSDLCDTNLLLPEAEEFLQGGRPTGGSIQLVDLEDCYAPGLTQPEVLAAGGQGYGQEHTRQWSADADLSPGALLIGEILAWPDPSLRCREEGSTSRKGDFWPQEPGARSDRFHAVAVSLEKIYGVEVGQLFQQAVLASAPGDLPSFARWKEALEGAQLGSARAEDGAGGGAADNSSGTGADNELAALIKSGQQFAALGMLNGACEKLEQAYHISPRQAAALYAEVLTRRGWKKERAEQLESALGDYQYARRIAPPELRDQYAQMAVKLRKTIESRRMTQAAAVTPSREEEEEHEDLLMATTAVRRERRGVARQIMALGIIGIGILFLLAAGGNWVVTTQRQHATQTEQVVQSEVAQVVQFTWSAQRTLTVEAASTAHVQTQEADALKQWEESLAKTSTQLAVSQASTAIAESEARMEQQTQAAAMQTQTVEDQKHQEEQRATDAARQQTETARRLLDQLHAAAGWNPVLYYLDSKKWEYKTSTQQFIGDITMPENNVLMESSGGPPFTMVLFPKDNLTFFTFEDYGRSNFYLAASIFLKKGAMGKIKGGLMFNYDPSGGYYSFEITNDQFYEVRYFDGVNEDVLVLDNSPAISRDSPNNLEVVAAYGQYVFAINGEYVTSLQLSRLGKGKPGLVFMQTEENIDSQFEVNNFIFSSNE